MFNTLKWLVLCLWNWIWSKVLPRKWQSFPAHSVFLRDLMPNRVSHFETFQDIFTSTLVKRYTRMYQQLGVRSTRAVEGSKRETESETKLKLKTKRNKESVGDLERDYKESKSICLYGVEGAGELLKGWWFVSSETECTAYISTKIRGLCHWDTAFCRHEGWQNSTDKANDSYSVLFYVP
jgi:hypothetical protein